MRAELRTDDPTFVWVFRVLGVACVGTALAIRLTLGPPLDAAFFVGTAMLFVAPLFRRRQVVRQAELEPRPGSLTLRSRGLFGGTDETRLEMRRLRGAAIATVQGRPRLFLTTDPRRAPLRLSLATDADLRAACDALGIGNEGFGAVVFARGSRALQHVAAWLRVLGAAISMIVVLLVFTSDPFAALLDVDAFVTKIVVGLSAFVALAPIVVARRTLTLHPQGVSSYEERLRSWRYDSIVHAVAAPSRIALTVREQKTPRDEPRTRTVLIEYSVPSSLLDGLTFAEAAAIASHVDAAAARTRAPRDPAGHRDLVHALVERRPDEPLREWIARLDQLGDSLRVAAPRHGEGESIPPMLWAAVEDHDADEVERALAARILSRIDPDGAPPKIRVVADRVRVESTAKRMRVAIDADPVSFAESLRKARA